MYTFCPPKKFPFPTEDVFQGVFGVYNGLQTCFNAFLAASIPFSAP